MALGTYGREDTDDPPNDQQYQAPLLSSMMKHACLPKAGLLWEFSLLLEA